MEDIKFSCPHCQQHFAAPPDMVAEIVVCPTCKQAIEVPVRCHMESAAGSSETPVITPRRQKVGMILRRCFLVYACTVLLYYTMPFHLIRDAVIGTEGEYKAPLTQLWDEWEMRDFRVWWAQSWNIHELERRCRTGGSDIGDGTYRLRAFQVQYGRVFWSFPAYFFVKKGPAIAILLVVPILIYRLAVWIIKDEKGIVPG